MNLSPLDIEDINSLKNELNQKIGFYLLLLLATTILSIGIVLFFNSNNIKMNPWVVYLFIGCLYILFVILNIHPIRRELKTGLKNIYTAEIQNKKSNIKHSWTGNAFADFTIKPILKEYIFTINNNDLFVDEITYSSLNIGDKIEIHQSNNTGKIYKIKKV